MHDPSKPNGYLRTIGAEDLTALSDYLHSDAALRNRFLTVVRGKCEFYATSEFSISMDDCSVLLHELLRVISHEDHLDFFRFDSALISLLTHDEPLSRSVGMIVLGSLCKADKDLACRVATDFIKRRLHIDLNDYEGFADTWVFSLEMQLEKAIMRIAVDSRMLEADRAMAEEKAQAEWTDSASTELRCEARLASELTQEYVWGWVFRFIPAIPQEEALRKEATCFIDRISFRLRPQLDESIENIDARLTVWHEGQVAAISQAE